MEHQITKEYPEITGKILAALCQLGEVSVTELKLKVNAIGGVGENAYGLVLQIHIESLATPTKRYILKIAPKNPARRSHMRVADYYTREVFMYDVIFRAYRNLAASHAGIAFDDLVPEMLNYSLDECDEFIIFEDLTQFNYMMSKRTQLPDYDMTVMALKSLAKLHAFSFALQAMDSKLFSDFIAKLQPDNLFTPDIEPLSIEFGKSYMRRALCMIQENADDASKEHTENHFHAPEYIKALQNTEKNFKQICLYCVDGCNCAPYAVICHGDFWNNNILFKYDDNKIVTTSKLLDFQMSRYASPILDLVHYLFICTTRDLRNTYFEHFLNDIYYTALGHNLHAFGLDISYIYPHAIFEQQLRDYGNYGLCMAAFSLPFFVADIAELPDLDKVSEAISDISTIAASTAQCDNDLDTTTTTTNATKELKESQRKLIEDEFNLLTERTAPIFMARMHGIVADIVKYRIKTDI